MKLDELFNEIESLTLNNKKIILLEDCINKQDEISEICLDLNVDLEYFSNANSALEAVMVSPPDLLIVDWRLPGSQDGISFINSVRKKCSNSIPILFFTDYASQDIRIQSLKNKATIFFDKAEPAELFIAQIETLLNLTNNTENNLSLSDNIIFDSISAIELKHFFNFHSVVQNNYRADVTIPEIIEIIEIDDYKLRFILNKYLNVSPQKYLTFYRLYIASQLLKKDCSIKEVSSCLGYSNTANFSNVFKKTYQLTPAQYQRDHQL